MCRAETIVRWSVFSIRCCSVRGELGTSGWSKKGFDGCLVPRQRAPLGVPAGGLRAPCLSSVSISKPFSVKGGWCRCSFFCAATLPENRPGPRREHPLPLGIYADSSKSPKYCAPDFQRSPISIDASSGGNDPAHQIRHLQSEIRCRVHFP